MTPKEYADQFLNMLVYLTPPNAPKYPDVMWHPAVTVALAFQTMNKSGFSQVEFDSKVAPQDDNGGIWCRTSVKRYRLSNSGEPVAKPGDDPKKPTGFKYYKDNLNGAIWGQKNVTVQVRRVDGMFEKKTFAEGRHAALSATTPFYGKGFPEDVQVCLQLRFRYQKSPHTLQTFVSNDFIGLDCNGFEGGYLRRRKDMAGWFRTEPGFGPDTPIRVLMKAEKPALFYTSMDQLQPVSGQMLLLAECEANGYIKDNDLKGGAGHIVISEPDTLKRKGDGTVCFTAVESTGGHGLSISEYTVKQVSKTGGVFTVRRGVTGMDLTFRIRPVTNED